MANDEITRHRGTVKIYYALRDYGFISRKQGKDVFFMRSAFPSEDHIVEGAVVEFEVRATPEGPRAENITRIG